MNTVHQSNFSGETKAVEYTATKLTSIKERKMKKYGALLAGAAFVLLTACDEQMAQSMGSTAAAELNCVAKTNEVVGVSGSSVSDVTKLEDGYSVLMKVPGAEQPWVCETDPAGNAKTVFYLGEG